MFNSSSFAGVFFGAGVLVVLARVVVLQSKEATEAAPNIKRRKRAGGKVEEASGEVSDPTSYRARASGSI